MIGFHFIVSPQIGTGHARRCAVLAQELARAGSQLHLFSDEPTILFSKELFCAGTVFTPIGSNPESLIEAIKNVVLEILIVDRYGFDVLLEKILKDRVGRLMVIDDFAGHPHECDILLDQNIGRSKQDWKELYATGTRVFAGAEYALLRSEFHDHRTKLSKNSTNIEKSKTIFICFGGMDMKNATFKVTKALLGKFGGALNIDIAIGSGSFRLEELVSLVGGVENVSLHIDSPNIAKLMSKATVAIGAPGSMTLERCCLHLPSILVSFAPNQNENGKKASEMGIAQYLGYYTVDVIPEIVNALDHLLDRPVELLNMSTKAKNLTDGLGAQKVISHILSKSIK